MRLQWKHSVRETIATRELQVLRLCTALGDACLHRLVAALPRNTHLQRLELSGNDTSGAFARTELLDAVQTNSSLLELRCGFESDDEYEPYAGHEAVAFVRSRKELRSL